jgi:hypothetical protein
MFSSATTLMFWDVWLVYGCSVKNETPEKNKNVSSTQQSSETNAPLCVLQVIMMCHTAPLPWNQAMLAALLLLHKMLKRH